MSDEEFEEAVFAALNNAKRSFHSTLSDRQFDPAYCDIRFTAWVKDVNFEHRLQRFEIEDECK